MNTCKSGSYFRNSQNIGFRLTTLYFDYTVAPLALTCPSPFFPLAWCIGNKPPRQIQIAPIAVQNAFALNMEQLALQMIVANTKPGIIEGATIYEPSPYGADYSNYYNQYIGAGVSSVSLVPPNPESVCNINGSAIKTMFAIMPSFWAEEAVNPTPLEFQDLFRMVRFIETSTDQRLWIPPGIYTVDEATDPPNLAAVAADPFFGANGVSILAIELKSID